jgi:hypothetical protein
MNYDYEYDFESFKDIKPYLMSNSFQIFEKSLYDNFPEFKEDGTSYYNEDGFLIKEKMHSGEFVSESENKNSPIIYKINKHGFRSDQFKKFEPENTNILFLGCSFTSGVGLPENLIWKSFMLNEMEKKFDNIVSYNLGVQGHSIHNCVNNFRVFIDKYGKPDYVFALFPGIERFTLYNAGQKDFVKVNATSWKELKGIYPKFVSDYVTAISTEDLIFSAIHSLHMLETICNQIGIKLIWSSWNQAQSKIFNEIDFKNFIEVEYPQRINLSKDFDTIPYYGENIDNLPYWNIARDLSHPGSGYHKIISKNFLQKFYINDL